MNLQVRPLIVSTLLALSVCVAAAQQTPPPADTPASSRPKADPEAAARTIAMAAGDTSPAAMEVMAFEKLMEQAVVRGDVAAVRGMLADDFVMVHGDGWMTGGKPLLEDNKESFLKRVENKQYLARDITTVKAEMHGDIAVLYGQYIAENTPGGTPRSWFSVWYERVYVKRNGKWLYLSHRTVHGPSYGPDRDSVAAK
jgi:hypothetical protein